MRIVIAGGTGFLGRPLSTRLAGDQHELVVLSRHAPPATAGSIWKGAGSIREIYWTAEGSGNGWAQAVGGADAVINLAGESIAAWPWTERHKARIEKTRVASTRAIVEAIRAAAKPPQLLLNASAEGYYGSRGDELLTE